MYHNQSHLESRLRECNEIDYRCRGQMFFLYLIILECFLCSNGMSICNNYLGMSMIDIVCYGGMNKERFCRWYDRCYHK